METYAAARIRAPERVTTVRGGRHVAENGRAVPGSGGPEATPGSLGSSPTFGGARLPAPSVLPGGSAPAFRSGAPPVFFSFSRRRDRFFFFLRPPPAPPILEVYGNS